MWKSNIAILFLSIILLSCSSSEPSLEYWAGEDFYPLDQKERIYNVEEIMFNITDEGSDTSRYLLKESIIDTIVSSTDTSFIIQREKQTLGQDSWVVDSLWSVTKRDKELLIKENNRLLVKLTFPMYIGKSWNGNAYNELNPLYYEYASLDTITFQSEVEAEQMMMVLIANQERTIVSEDLRYEVYAKGIGLLEKKYKQLNYCTTCDPIGEDIISGRILNQYLLTYD